MNKKKSMTTFRGQFVDLENRTIYPAELIVEEGTIVAIERLNHAPDQYLLPGFIDAHVHIESSMLTPAAFAKIAVEHGTIATISDPHEIANVCGIAGVQYMIENSLQTPFKIFFGAPSCVPATAFETAGATLNARTVEELLQQKDIWYLTEMMNYPGVLQQDPEVMSKMAAAKRCNKPIDGHAPGLRGSDAIAYAAAGIRTDHECSSLPEAQDKLDAGMHILIREGSAAKNFEALHPLLASHPDRVMFCSDDKHPDALIKGHINELVARAMALGYNVFDVLKAACINPVKHYKVPVGQLQVGDAADFIVVKDLISFSVLKTIINGQIVAEDGKSCIPEAVALPINHFEAERISTAQLIVKAKDSSAPIPVIEALDGQLLTKKRMLQPQIENGRMIADANRDILKIVVLNRYEKRSQPAIAFIKGFGLKEGALASTVAHDCHNLIAVGVDDDAIAAALNALIDCKGGISFATSKGAVMVLPLPIAGLMSGEDGYDVARRYTQLDAAAKAAGSNLAAPFMTLSFMALLVIPSLKLSDKGLFDGERFCFVNDGF